MTFARAKLGGWSLGEILTSGQMNQLDIDHVDSLDGGPSTGGGTYSPAARLTWRQSWTFDGDALPVSGLNDIVTIDGNTAFSSASPAVAVLQVTGHRNLGAGTPGDGVSSTGGESATTLPGAGLSGVGGESTNVAFDGGLGASLIGGLGADEGGAGITTIGGVGTVTRGGKGIVVLGGVGGTRGGLGAEIDGGDAQGGGAGVDIEGGAGTGVDAGGIGGLIKGGASSIGSGGGDGGSGLIVDGGFCGVASQSAGAGLIVDGGVANSGSVIGGGDGARITGSNGASTGDGSYGLILKGGTSGASLASPNGAHKATLSLLSTQSVPHILFEDNVTKLEPTSNDHVRSIVWSKNHLMGTCQMDNIGVSDFFYSSMVPIAWIRGYVEGGTAGPTANVIIQSQWNFDTLGNIATTSGNTITFNFEGDGMPNEIDEYHVHATSIDPTPVGGSGNIVSFPHVTNMLSDSFTMEFYSPAGSARDLDNGPNDVGFSIVVYPMVVTGNAGF